MKSEPTLERAIASAGRLLAAMLKIRSLALRIRRRQDAFTVIVFKSRRHHLVRPYSFPEQLRWASEAMDVLREAVRSSDEHEAVIRCSKLRLQELRADKNLPYDSAGITEVLYAWQRARRELQKFGSPKAFAKANREIIALLEVDALKAALRTDWRVARVVGQQQVRTGANATPKKSSKGKRINEQLTEAIQRNHDLVHWSAKQLAKVLGCSKSTIIGTSTWKALQKLREQERSARTDSDRYSDRPTKRPKKSHPRK